MLQQNQPVSLDTICEAVEAAARSGQYRSALHIFDVATTAGKVTPNHKLLSAALEACAIAPQAKKFRKARKIFEKMDGKDEKSYAVLIELAGVLKDFGKVEYFYKRGLRELGGEGKIIEKAYLHAAGNCGEAEVVWNIFKKAKFVNLEEFDDSDDCLAALKAAAAQKNVKLTTELAEQCEKLVKTNWTIDAKKKVRDIWNDALEATQNSGKEAIKMMEMIQHKGLASNRMIYKVLEYQDDVENVLRVYKDIKKSGLTAKRVAIAKLLQLQGGEKEAEKIYLDAIRKRELPRIEVDAGDFISRNKWIRRGKKIRVLDLHEHTYGLALVAVKRWFKVEQQSGGARKDIYIITGIGKRSVKGEAVIRPMILKWLEENGWKGEICKENEGVVKVEKGR
eukprot:g5914.t1